MTSIGRIIAQVGGRFQMSDFKTSSQGTSNPIDALDLPSAQITSESIPKYLGRYTDLCNSFPPSQLITFTY